MKKNVRKETNIFLLLIYANELRSKVAVSMWKKTNQGYEPVLRAKNGIGRSNGI